jgi:hypothetical protein
VENRVIYVRSYGVVSVAEIQTASLQTGQMMNSGIKFVHMIADSTEVAKLTFNLTDLVKGLRGLPTSPNLGWSLNVSPNMLYRFMASIIAQIVNSRQRVFNTLNEAIVFLQSVDETLPQIPHPSKAGES